MEHASQNPSADSVTGMAFNLPRSISQEQSHAYKKKTNAPAIMERASVAAYIFPFAAIVRPRVASAMEGAAPNNPAKLLGFSTSPNAANADTTIPPITNLKTRSFTGPPEAQKFGMQHDARVLLTPMVIASQIPRPFKPQLGSVGLECASRSNKMLDIARSVP
jgi:hypothetical protein